MQWSTQAYVEFTLPAECAGSVRQLGTLLCIYAKQLHVDLFSHREGLKESCQINPRQVFCSSAVKLIIDLDVIVLTLIGMLGKIILNCYCA